MCFTTQAVVGTCCEQKYLHVILAVRGRLHVDGSSPA